MANKTEFSRLVFKRSTVTGVIPTEPTGTTIDNTWLSTDILIGEGFINVEDDKMWYRTNNGIVEVSLSGISSHNYYTDYVYLSGNVLTFDRTDKADAYSVDLSALTGFTGGGGGGNYLPLSGGTLTGPVSADTLFISTVGSGTSIINLGLDASGQVVTGTTGGSGSFTGGTITGDVTFAGHSIFQGTAVMDELSATTVSILNSGATSRAYFDYSTNTIESGVTNSAIIAGSGNTIQSGVRNTIVSGVDITASANDTAYFSNVNISKLTSPITADTIYMTTSKSIKAVGGGGAIEIGVKGLQSDVRITTDGALGSDTFWHLNPAEIEGRIGGLRWVKGIGTTTASGVTHNTGHAVTFISSQNLAYSSGITNSVALGGKGLTMDASDTAYVDNLNIGTVGAGTPTINLGLDSSGNVVTGATSASGPCDFSFAISDETTQITSGADKLAFYAPYDMTITNVYASLSLSGDGTSQYDINNNGTTILSTVITIDAHEYHSNNATTPPVITGATVSQFDRITVDIDSVDGSGQAGAKIYIVGTRA